MNNKIYYFRLDLCMEVESKEYDSQSDSGKRVKRLIDKTYLWVHISCSDVFKKEKHEFLDNQRNLRFLNEVVEIKINNGGLARVKGEIICLYGIFLPSYLWFSLEEQGRQATSLVKHVIIAHSTKSLWKKISNHHCFQWLFTLNVNDDDQKATQLYFWRFRQESTLKNNQWVLHSRTNRVSFLQHLDSFSNNSKIFFLQYPDLISNSLRSLCF